MRTIKELRHFARHCFDASVAAADPGDATRRAVEGKRWESWKNVRAVAFGKAACAMASALDAQAVQALAGRIS